MASTRMRRPFRPFVFLAAVGGILLLLPSAAQAMPDTPTKSPSASAVATAAPKPAVTPAPTTQAQVLSRLNELSRQSERLSEQLNAAEITLKKSQAAATAASKRATAAGKALALARKNLAFSLAAQYRASSFSRTAALLASSSGQGYIDAVQSMGLIATHQAEVASIAASTSVRSVLAQHTAAVASAAARTQRDTLVARRTAMQAEVTKYNRMLRSLTVAARAQYYAATAATPMQIKQLFSFPLVPASKAAGVAIAAARAELGKPYVYGASGPSSFDCSGLTAWAWAAAGISLPHNAAAQYGYGTHVSQSQLLPGDLVFFYSPIGHVGIYIGGGLMIHAPTSGDVVKISPVMGDFVGATRIA